jgi:hypothetical protein
MLGTAYPVASEEGFDAVLSERDRPDGERRPIPLTAWSFVASGGGAAATEITLDGGSKPGRIYELTYTADDPIVSALSRIPCLCPWPQGGTHRAPRTAPKPHTLEAVMSLRVCKAHLWLRHAQPSGSPQLRFGAPRENWLVKTGLRQPKARARQRFLLDRKARV